MMSTANASTPWNLCVDGDWLLTRPIRRVRDVSLGGTSQVEAAGQSFAV